MLVKLSYNSKHLVVCGLLLRVLKGAISIGISFYLDSLPRLQPLDYLSLLSFVINLR